MQQGGNGMSRNGLIVAAVALVLAIGALVLQFVLPSAGGSIEASELAALRNDVAALKSQQVSRSGLKIAYMNAESAFSVFTSAVSDLRQKTTDKVSEITALQTEFMQSTISKEEYQRRANELNAELLDARLATDTGTLDRMIASDGFSDLRSDLERLREVAQPIVEEVKNLVSTAKVGVIDATEFQSRYQRANEAFTQLDQLLTQAATAKIQQAAQRIALQKGFDLVIPVKNVVVYVNPASLTDITDLVKAEIANYL
jgi:Skp family chaperone for outer membrane proteins